jgi:hypothetical protein
MEVSEAGQQPGSRTWFSNPEPATRLCLISYDFPPEHTGISLSQCWRAPGVLVVRKQATRPDGALGSETRVSRWVALWLDSPRRGGRCDVRRRNSWVSLWIHVGGR